MAELNFNLLNQGAGPNIGDAAGYFEAGRKARQNRTREQALAAGDLDLLRTVDPETAAQIERQNFARADRRAKITGAQSAARGDWRGARDAFASTGDVGAVSDVDAMHDAEVKQIAEEAAFLQGVFAKSGPAAMLQAYDQRAANYRMTPEQGAQIRQALEAAPEATLTALAGAPTYKYQRAADGSIIGINEATGEAKELYKGTRPAPSGYRYGQDGELEPIPGGPADPEVIGGNATVRRQVVVNNPTKKTGGKAKSGGKRAVQSYSDDELFALAGVKRP